MKSDSEIERDVREELKWDPHLVDAEDIAISVKAYELVKAKGLRPRVASMCDELVALPLRGRVGSLNVSATAAVLLYEMLQQRLDAST